MAETRCGMAKVIEKNFKIKRLVGELVVVSSIVVMSQMAVRSQSSKLRGSVVVDTWQAGLALMWCLQPSQDRWVQVSDTVVQDLEEWGQEMGAVKR
jgi:hypothetical protein